MSGSFIRSFSAEQRPANLVKIILVSSLYLFPFTFFSLCPKTLLTCMRMSEVWTSLLYSTVGCRNRPVFSAAGFLDLDCNHVISSWESFPSLLSGCSAACVWANTFPTLTRASLGLSPLALLSFSWLYLTRQVDYSLQRPQGETAVGDDALVCSLVWKYCLFNHLYICLCPKCVGYFYILSF